MPRARFAKFVHSTILFVNISAHSRQKAIRCRIAGIFAESEKWDLKQLRRGGSYGLGFGALRRSGSSFGTMAEAKDNPLKRMFKGAWTTSQISKWSTHEYAHE